MISFYDKAFCLKTNLNSHFPSPQPHIFFISKVINNMHLRSLDESRACTGTTRSKLSPDTALIVQFSVWAAQIGGKTSLRAERTSCLRTLLWTNRGSSSASWVCPQYSAGSLWRTATPLRVGESPAHQSLPSPFTVRCGSPSKLIEGKKKKNAWEKKTDLLYREGRRKRGAKRGWTEQSCPTQLPGGDDQSESAGDHCVKLAPDCNDEIKNAIRVKTRSVSAIGQVE